MTSVQFIGIDPGDLIQEIANQVRISLLPEISQKTNEVEYLTAEEICRRLSITKPTLHEWRKRNIVKSYKIGARVYYRWDEVQKAMIIND